MAPSRPGRCLVLSLLLLSAGHRSDSFPASISQQDCPEGTFKDRLDNTEICQPCTSEDRTIHPNCNSVSERESGHMTSTEPDALHHGSTVTAGVRHGRAENDHLSVKDIILIVVLTVAVVVAVAAVFYYRKNIGQAFMVGIHKCRNSFKMQTAPKIVEMVDMNGHSNPEANHNLLPGGNPDSADSVVPEVPLQSGHPYIPVPAQETQEQDPERTSVAGSA